MTDTAITHHTDTPRSNIDWVRLFTSFRGRIPRSTFWIGFAILVAVSAAVQFGVFAAVNASDLEVAMIVAAVPFVYPALALYAKRCHDRGKSAWWLLMLAVPIAGFVWLVYELGMQPSVAPDPYGTVHG